MNAIITEENYSNQGTESNEVVVKEKLFLHDSQIPGAGKGLFTSVKFYKGDVIALFYGEFLTDEEVEKRTEMNEGNYFIGMQDGTTLDCFRVEGYAKYANDAKGFIKTNFKNNSVITFDENDKLCLAAKRDIHAGEEIFCGYGAAYWKVSKKSTKNFL